MKKFLTFMLGICLIIPCTLMFSACKKDPGPQMEIWDGTTIEVSEAVNDVITIETAEELAGLAKSVNEGTSYEGITIKLTCDMDLANKEWKPIGFGSSGGTEIMDGNSVPFRGIFDGQNHTIHNLKIISFVGGGLDGTTPSGIGLFGHVIGSVKNITVNNATVAGNHYVGAVIGFATGAEIDNCHAKNVTVSCTYANDDESGDKAGVVIGFISNTANESSIIKNCSAYSSNVNADRDAGRVLGCLSVNNYGTETTVNYENLTSDLSVNVSWNQTGDGIKSSSGTNITQDVIGRINN